jgi:hypothetical protein
MTLLLELLAELVVVDFASQEAEVMAELFPVASGNSGGDRNC